MDKVVENNDSSNIETIKKPRARKTKSVTETSDKSHENNIQMEIVSEKDEKQKATEKSTPKEGDEDYVPDFSFINECYREMIITAYKTVNRLKAWDWFRTFSPLPHEGYMFCSDPVAVHIMSIIAHDFSEVIEKSDTLEEQDNHDRGSMSRTMRTLQFIATKGFDKFHEYYFSELK